MSLQNLACGSPPPRGTSGGGTGWGATSPTRDPVAWPGEHHPLEGVGPQSFCGPGGVSSQKRTPSVRKITADSPLKGAVYFSLLLPLLLAGCLGPRGDHGDFDVDEIKLDFSDSTAYLPQLEGPLRALSATPYGPMAGMAPAQPIAITFSKPMVPLGKEPDVDRNAIQVRPEVPGTVQWEGSQTLVYQPSQDLPPSTAFTVTVTAGLAALDGDKLARPIRWTFETPRPALVSSEPASGEPYVAPTQAFRLQFNQAVRSESASRFIRLNRNGGSSVGLNIERAGDSTLVVRPRSALAKGTSYELLVLPGLQPTLGDLPSSDTARIAFETYANLRLVSVGGRQNEWEPETKVVNPQREIVFTFSTPVRFGDMRRALTFSPAVQWPAGIEAQDGATGAIHAVRLPLQPETNYTVTVRNLRDQFGQVLASATHGFRTGAYEPSLSMPAGIVVIEAQQRRFVPLRVTNVNNVSMGLRRLTADQIVPLIRGYDTQHYYGDQPDGQAPPAPATNRSIQLGVQRNRPTIKRIELDSLLRGGKGAVGIRVTTTEVRDDLRRDFRTVALVTNLGITAKFSPHQNLFLVSDLRSAKPVPGATITLRDQQNRVRWRGRTDAKGRIASPGWARLRIAKPNPWQSPILFAFAEKEGDLTFTSSVYQDGIEPYRFDIPYEWSPEAITTGGSIFTDRGLYRAGETVNIKGILRKRTESDWLPVTGDLRVLLVSPREQIVLDRYVRAGAFGTFHTEWTAPPTATQGMYTVRVVYASDTAAVRRNRWDRGDIATGDFRVDAFRRATFNVTAQPSTPTYVAGDFFEGTITGRYLFGADMAGQPVRYSLVRMPGFYAPPGFEGYRFGSFPDDEYSYDERQALVESDTVLGPGGVAKRRLQLPISTNGAPATLYFTATVTDPARQEFSTRTEITLHPGQFYIGLKPSTTFIDVSRRKSIMVDVITIDPAGRPVDGQEIDVELVRQQWNSVREVGTDGRLRWRSERTEEVLGQQHLRSRPGVAKRITIPVTQGGSYVVRASSRDVRGNVIRSDAYFYAAGEGYVAWERADDDRIDIVPDKQSYAPGETARILVQSPYEEVTALVTLEREGVLSSSVMTLRGSAPMISVPLSERHLPNVFVSVVLLKGRTAQAGAATDAGLPGFKIGMTNLRVDPGRRHLDVRVTPNKPQYRPGEEVTIDLAVTDPDGRAVQGEVTFSAADAGVLNLIGYSLPDPFDAFYGIRPLGVTTTETRANLIEQRSYGQKEEDIIGGGGDPGYMLRKDFRPQAHWAPAVRTDNRGRARLRFRMPESLTTFRLMATAVATGNRFGQGRTDVVVTQPLVLQPALPRFVRPGDTFEAGVLVSNMTGTPGDATLTVRPTGLRLVGGASQTVRLGAGETREVRFRWSATSQVPARLQFEARLAGERDAFLLDVPVLPATTRQVNATFASTTSSTREAIQLPAGRVPGTGRMEVRLSSTAMVGLDGAARYLFEYPYGCLEQRTSAVRPFLVAADLIDAFKIAVPGGDRRRVVDGWIQDLPEFWIGEGFSMWAGQRDLNPYVSAYVVLALAEAREAGFQVPENITRSAVEMLAYRLRNRSERPNYYSIAAWDDTRALILYALARHGRVFDDEIRTLATGGTPSVEGAAYLLRAVVAARRPSLNDVRDLLLDRLRREIRVEATTAYLAIPENAGLEWVFSTNTRATALGMTALIEAAPDPDTRQLTGRMVRYLMQQRGQGHWATTQENAMVLDALRAYYRAYESGATRFDASVLVAGRSILNETFQGKTLRVATATRALPAGSGVMPVDFRLSGQGMLYYSLLIESYSTQPQQAATHGLAVSRTIRRLNRQGEPVGPALPSGAVQLRAGELVEVTLRVSSPADRSFVVVDDALPAGLEALNAALRSADPAQAEAMEVRGYREGRGWVFNHTEIRDDRVVVFADYLPQGEHTFTYLARATTPGRFVHPPLRAEMMYQPETNGQTATGTLVVASQ